jgi:hypothetical protein
MNTGKLVVSLFDGEAKPLAAAEPLITLRDGFGRQVHRDFHKRPNVEFTIPIAENAADRYSVVAWVPNCRQAGFTPLQVRAGVDDSLDLMLVPNRCHFNFANANWDTLLAKRPALTGFLQRTDNASINPRDFLENLIEQRPATAASVLNICATLLSVPLPNGTALDYLRDLDWSDIRNDRFFAYADEALLQLLQRNNTFKEEQLPGVFHPDATHSYKQTIYGEANVQVTFMTKINKNISGKVFFKVDVDIDYFADAGAHALLEIIPNTFFGTMTDPLQVYILRWIAAKRRRETLDPCFVVVPD